MAGLVKISMGKFMKIRWKSVQDLQILGRDFENLEQTGDAWGWSWEIQGEMNMGKKKLVTLWNMDQNTAQKPSI